MSNKYMIKADKSPFILVTICVKHRVTTILALRVFFWLKVDAGDFLTYSKEVGV
jgi:hypothetical protein